MELAADGLVGSCRRGGIKDNALRVIT